MSYSHDEILAQGWKEYQSSRYYGHNEYRKYMSETNPYLLAYFRLYQELIDKEKAYNQLLEQKKHYESRYNELAKANSEMIATAAKVGVSKDSYKA